VVVIVDNSIIVLPDLVSYIMYRGWLYTILLTLYKAIWGGLIQDISILGITKTLSKVSSYYKAINKGNETGLELPAIVE